MWARRQVLDLQELGRVELAERRLQPGVRRRVHGPHQSLERERAAAELPLELRRLERVAVELHRTGERQGQAGEVRRELLDVEGELARGHPGQVHLRVELGPGLEAARSLLLDPEPRLHSERLGQAHLRDGPLHLAEGPARPGDLVLILDAAALERDHGSAQGEGQRQPG